MAGTSASDYLDPIKWGTSSGGAAGNAETDATLGTDRLDKQVPPDQYRVSGLGITRQKQLLMQMSAYFKGGTRLQVLKQSSNPFGAGESGFYVNTSGTAYIVVDGTPTAMGAGGSTGNYTFSSNTMDLSGAATMSIAPTTATAITLGQNTTLTSGKFITTATSATVPPTITWTAVTFVNSWVNEGSGTWYDCAYYKDAMGFVHVRGACKNGTGAATIFTLPTGYRPTKQVYSPTFVNGTTATYFQVTTGGAVSTAASANTFVALDGLIFYAEQ